MRRRRRKVERGVRGEPMYSRYPMVRPSNRSEQFESLEKKEEEKK